MSKKKDKIYFPKLIKHHPSDVKIRQIFDIIKNNKDKFKGIKLKTIINDEIDDKIVDKINVKNDRLLISFKGMAEPVSYSLGSTLFYDNIKWFPDSILKIFARIGKLPEDTHKNSLRVSPDYILNETAELVYEDKDGKKKVTELPITPSEDGLSTSGMVETEDGTTKSLTITADSMEKLRDGIIAGLEEIEAKYGKIVTIYKKKEELDKDESALIIRDNKVPAELTDLLDENIDINKIADVDQLNDDIQHILKTEEDEDERAEKIREAVQKQRRNIKTKEIKLNLQKRKPELNALLNKFEKYKKEGGAFIDPKTGRVISVANNKNRKKGEPVMVGMANPNAK